MNIIQLIWNFLCLHEFVWLVHVVVERYAGSIGWHPLALVSLNRCGCKFVGQRWRCPNYHAIIAKNPPLFGREQLSLDQNQIRGVSHSSRIRVYTLAYIKMEQVDGTVARHITRTSPPNKRESTALVILFWISINRSHKNVTLCKFKRKRRHTYNSYALHSRRTPTVRLTRLSPEGTCVVLHFHWHVGLQFNKPSIAEI